MDEFRECHSLSFAHLPHRSPRNPIMSTSFIVTVVLEYLWDERFWLFLSALFVFYFLSYVWRRFFSLQGLPSHFPWAGAGYGVLRRGRASWQSLFGLRQLLIDGYENVSKYLFSNDPVFYPKLIPSSILNESNHSYFRIL